MIECISTLSVLGVIALALLLMTRAISLEEAGALFVRGFVAVVLALWALCTISRLLATALPIIKSAVIWIGVIAFVIVLVSLTVKLSLRLGTRSKSNNRGER